MTHQSVRTSIRQLIQFHRCSAINRSYGQNCQRSVSCPPFPTRCIATSSNLNNNDRILGRSTIFLQDGLDINEMPIVVRRMGANDILFKNELYGGVEIASVSAKDKEFKQKLIRCETLKGVFKLLDVGDEDVTPYSAAFALQRLSLIQKDSSADIDSFVSKAILNELCETTTRGIQSLENKTLLTLVRCYCSSSRESYPQKFVTDVNNEVERRIGENKFQVGELCKLLEIVLNCTHTDSELINNLWIHLGNRYKEIDETNIAQAYALWKYMSKEQRFLYPLITRRFSQVWWKVNIRDAVSICQSVTHCNQSNHQQMALLAQWIYVNLHDVKTDDMITFIAMFSHFSIHDVNFIKALERFFVAKHKHFDVTLFAMAMEYCRKVRHQSVKIFDLSAAHFEKNSALYGQMETLFVLRPLGQLNYVPPNASQLFAEIEELMDKWFDKMEPHLLLELLVSFVYINRFPKNFVGDIFSLKYFEKLRNSMFWSNPYGRTRTANWIWSLIVALRVDVQSFEELYYSPSVLQHRGRESRKHNSTYICHSLSALGIKQSLYRRLVSLSGHLSGYFVDVILQVNQEKQVVPSSTRLLSGQGKRIAILLTSPSDYCLNTAHFTGAFATKKRHLESQGFTVLLFDAMSVSLNREEAFRLLRTELAKHIKFTHGKAHLGDLGDLDEYERKDEDLEYFSRSEVLKREVDEDKHYMQKALLDAMMEQKKKDSREAQQPKRRTPKEWDLQNGDSYDDDDLW